MEGLSDNPSNANKKSITPWLLVFLSLPACQFEN